VNYLTREEILAKIRDEYGIIITDRTLKYWESIGLLPHPTYIGRDACYLPSMAKDIVMIYHIKNDIVAIVRKHRKHLTTIILGVSNEQEVE
jgi:hypothetical protein